jgi:hypothetical protein
MRPQANRNIVVFMDDRIMAESQLETDYPVLVTKRDGAYDLRIRELLLFVSGPDLQQVYNELLKRKQEVIDCAREIGSLDELPLPSRPPLLLVTNHPPTLFHRTLAWLCNSKKRWF